MRRTILTVVVAATLAAGGWAARSAASDIDWPEPNCRTG
jgi:hypothetical protein